MIYSKQISMEVDQLTDLFSKGAILTVRNYTGRCLYLQEGGVYTGEYLQKNTVIGDIQGDPAYLWDVSHRDFLFVDHDLVLDVHRFKHNILSYIREENETSHVSNCFLQMDVDPLGNERFYLVTKTPIMPHQELVYNTADFVGPHAGEEGYPF